MKNKALLLLLVFVLAPFMAVSAQDANLWKMSPMIARQMQSYRMAKRLQMQANSSPESGAIMALVKLQDEGSVEALTSRGCGIIDNIGRIYVTMIPESSIAELSLDERVERLEANPLPSLHLDSLIRSNNIMPVYAGTNLPQAYTGKGIVVGVADIGFDFTHPMFLDSEGHSRVRQAWELYTGKGTGYKGIGTLYTNEEELLRDAPYMADTVNMHATHVMGIAAGSPVLGGKYRGIAYEADLVASQAHLNGHNDQMLNNMVNDINAHFSDDPIWGQTNAKKITLSDAMIVLVIKHIMDYANEHNQPCVVNCSFGNQMDFADDRSLVSEMITALVGPGRIIVASAGNNSDTDLYRMKASSETLDTKLWIWPAHSMTPQITMKSDKPFKLTIRPDIDECPAVTVSSENFELASSDYSHYHYAIITSEENKYGISRAVKYPKSDGSYAYSLTIELPDPNKNKYNSPSLEFKIESEGMVEILGEYDRIGFSQFSTYPTNCQYTIGFPATIDEVISVGLLSYREKVKNLNGVLVEDTYNKNPVGRVVSWSGTGPTLDGRIKPDITASGYNIVSAYSSNLLNPNKYTKADGKYIDEIIAKMNNGKKDYYMLLESGTSMAAPVVTGIIALWLQADPTLTPTRIKEVFAQTAAHPDPTLSYPNNMYGHGAIDAYRGLCNILGIADHIEGFYDHQPQGLEVSISGTTLRLGNINNASVKIYTLSGQLVQSAFTADGTLSLTSLPAGVYAVQIDTDSAATTGSTLIRIQ